MEDQKPAKQTAICTGYFPVDPVLGWVNLDAVLPPSSGSCLCECHYVVEDQ